MEISKGRRLHSFIFAASVSCVVAPPAFAAELDCKVILCLAGGFPSGCEDARRYMLDRIRSLPPKPPFGTCQTVSVDGTRSTYSDAAASIGTASTPKTSVRHSGRDREEARTYCTRRCWTERRQINLSIRQAGGAPYRARYVLSERQRCEDLTRAGVAADDQR